MSELHDELRRLVSGFRAHLAWRQRGGTWAAPGGASPRPEGQPGIAASEPAPSGSGESLQVVREDLGDCTRCKLHETRTNIVFGVGSPNADLMFVGEGPGAEEDRRGEPFVGKAGQLLDRMIAAMGWSRDTVYIANVVKCLRYNARVQLGDGSWERIGRLVRNRYRGDVMSVDEAGNLVRRRVIGWHATPLADRPVYRLTYASATAVGASRSGIQLTGDHPVLTDKGYVAVEDLPPGARIAIGQGVSEVARDVVYGTLLGDGHISAKNAHLAFGHSIHQREYVDYKMEALREFTCSSRALQVAAGGDRQYPVVHARTLAHRALAMARADFYAPTKRVPSGLASGLTQRMLAVWFMDDGHLRIRPPRQPNAEIATCGFPEEDLPILAEGLARLGVGATIRRGRLHFDVEQTLLLSAMIAPYVPPCMRHKVHPMVEKRVPYDPALMQPGPRRVVFDEAEVERLDFNGTDKTFFCIDVEETHNFVTAGGVVHNCRPPGNRDPEPDEVESCSPFLWRQIESVAPRVLVTLGRPAAHLVLGTQAPISRLRGRWLEVRGVRVMPTFHPAYLLRSPDKKREAWDDLKLVIAELEQLGVVSPNPAKT